ncbi:hypothetical protein HN858_02595 [Candidatus Falkowbacteria bacterium]|jgi:hypothetical protein|nr:hypothetical protein [Candidatus Falkowbacteria bacterium]MBT5503820.1 hypothetical protein [Candidatus Falkowbacteria bacterium]MBT6573855.1 hypothetical protein [Candidatus Falkowbacteria bacterium]MBT7348545.1 hypothetical protein [Candidatus Falkowbacteria bacterium]MBT7501071.1 hypothetical protein [Candidatus Falkowbacteria bacterium]
MFGLFKKKPATKPVVKTKRAPVEDSKNDNSQVLATIKQMQKELDRLKSTVTDGSLDSLESETVGQSVSERSQKLNGVQKNGNEKVLEGVFDGQNMIGADGQQYDVPANYASKSKLVEGDILKLTINNLGSFVYKQIKPIDRMRIVGELTQDDQSLQFYAQADGKKWKLLTASVTYYKGEAGDEVIFLIPSEGGSRWAAVENIVKE